MTSVISAIDALLSPLDLRIRDILVKEYVDDNDQLIWKSLASTYVSNLKGDYKGSKLHTVLTSPVYLVITSKADKGKAEQAILDASADQDIEIIITKAGLPCSRLPADLSVDSPDFQIRRALMKVIEGSPGEKWGREVVDGTEIQTRKIVKEELGSRQFRNMFRDTAVNLSPQTHTIAACLKKLSREKKGVLDDELLEKIVFAVVDTEAFIRKKDNIDKIPYVAVLLDAWKKKTANFDDEDKRKVKKAFEDIGDAFFRNRPDYYLFEIFPEVAVKEIVKGYPTDDTEDQRYKMWNTGRCDFLVTDSATRPCFVVEFDGEEHDKPDQKIKDQARDQVLSEAGVPVVRVGWDEVEGYDKNKRDRLETVSFQLLISVLFEIHRRNLLYEEKRWQLQEEQDRFDEWRGLNYEDTEDPLDQVMREMDAEAYLDYQLDDYVHSNSLFDYGKWLKRRSGQEILRIKEIDSEYSSEFEEFDTGLKLTCTLPSRKKGPKKFAHTRPRITAGGTWEKIYGIGRAVHWALVWSMLWEVRNDLEIALEKGDFEEDPIN